MKNLSYEIPPSGLDYIKDGRNLASPNFCRFETRAKVVIMEVIEGV